MTNYLTNSPTNSPTNLSTNSLTYSGDRHVPITFEKITTVPARLSLRSPLTGALNTIETNRYDQSEFDRRWYAYQNGCNIDEAFPGLSTNFKNFIITGIPDHEWEDYQEKGDNINIGMDKYFL